MNEKKEVVKVKVDLSKVTEKMTTTLATAEVVMDLQKEYLRLEKSKPKRFLFVETGEQLDISTGELTPTVTLLDDQRKLFITRTVVIYNACKDLKAYSGLELEFLGEKELDNGNKLKQYRVTLLNV